MKQIDRTIIQGNLIDVIESHRRRLDILERLLRGAPIGSTGTGIVGEGPGIDIVGGSIVGLGGDTILIYNSDGAPVEEFAATGDGLVQALAAAGVGDIVQLPAITIMLSVSITIPTGVTVRGAGGNQTSIIQSVGDVGSYLVVASGAPCQMELVQVIYNTANSASDRSGINQTGDGSAIRRCLAQCTNAGAGGATGHRILPASGYAYASYGSGIGISAGGAGYGFAALPNADLRSCYGVAYNSNTSAGIYARGAYIRQCQGGSEIATELSDYGMYINAPGTTLIIGGDTIGNTKDLYINTSAVAQIYGLHYDTSTNNGTLTYLGGDRAAYSVEDLHATDIEATALTRHLPLPGAAGGIARSDGTNWARVALADYLGVRNIATITAGTTTLNTTHDAVLCNAAGGAITVNLPAVATNTGRKYTIKKIDSSANAVTIDANASELIDGATTQVIQFQYTSLDIICDGAAWYII